jgi:hypothetical protein
VFVVSQRSALYVYDTSTGAPPAVIKVLMCDIPWINFRFPHMLHAMFLFWGSIKLYGFV